MLVAQQWLNEGVTSDGNLYFAYLRSLVFDHDLQIGPELDFLHLPPRPHNVVPVGPSILWAPFYLIVAGADWLETIEQLRHKVWIIVHEIAREEHNIGRERGSRREDLSQPRLSCEQPRVQIGNDRDPSRRGLWNHDRNALDVERNERRVDADRNGDQRGPQKNPRGPG